ncbi:hypothetical protein [Streptomyces sp. NPDC102462]|uniref:hypothetical protein n=1 Tax=Streptomyces sp. NPDC102462 TaxID=3366178 RepID=UPI0037F9F7D9
MRIRHTTLTIAVAALALTACSTSDSGTETHETTVTTSTGPKTTGLTAEQAAAELAEATGVTTLGNPTDNTGSCSDEAAGKDPRPNDCSQLITTDTVSIYEFRTPEIAADWVTTMKKQGDWRQVGRFALAWTARDQGLTSDDRRAELVRTLKKETADEA